MKNKTLFTEEQIKTLENKVLSFLKEQPGYEKYSSENLRAFQEDKRDIGVIFGSNLQAGIAGFGANVDKAYADFVGSWNDLNGFTWIENNR